MDHKIQIDEKTVNKLLKRAAAQPEGPLLELLNTLAGAPENFTRKNAVLAEFRKTLKACRAYTPEQKETLVTSLEDVLDVLRIESSDGLLNEWLHGISL